MTDPSLQIEIALRHARGLEDAILEAREEYADLGEDIVDEYTQPLVEELHATRERINAALGLKQPTELLASLWLRLRGGRVGEGKAPLDSLETLLGSLQTGVRQLAAYIETGEPALRRVPRHLEERVDLDLVAFQAGSARIAVAPHRPQLDLSLEGGDALPDAAIKYLLHGLVIAQERQGEEVLAEFLPHPVLRRQIASRIKEFAPSSRAGYEVVELSGRVVPESTGKEILQVGREAYDYARYYLERTESMEVEYRGLLVAVDVEKDRLELRVPEGRITCEFESPRLHERAKKFLEEFVEIRGIGEFREGDELPSTIFAREMVPLSPDDLSGDDVR